MTLTDLLQVFSTGRHHYQYRSDPRLYLFLGTLLLLGLLLQGIRRMRFIRMMTPERLPGLPAEQVHAGRQCAVAYLFTRFFGTVMLLALLLLHQVPQVAALREYFVPWGIIAVGLLGISLWLQSQATPVVKELAQVLRAERAATAAERQAQIEAEGEELDRIAQRQ